ncbi:hypothetical protein PMI22_02066 [Pseudomonas sp. GM21]|uniref:DUF6124 family protein n=1 Tax=Pseudomonas TaxID=286 RepID=UPI0002726A35|nr:MULTISPECIES: hypothetical protein [Pseudomonas]EJM21182.1 hypothetical protein PMI22_02066 [Pseudomonas sp. GM21]MDR6926026.1 hypothetical protein [Pseudomonas sp. BE134]MDR7283343.1 hypothetical protein [Pseudomonas corrugata]
MKKFNKSQLLQTQIQADNTAPAKVCDTAKTVVTPHPKHIPSPRQIFAIIPGVDTLTLLNEACEMLATLNVLIANFASKLDGPNLNVLLSIQQLATVAEMSLNQVRDNLYPRDDAPASQTPTWH